MNFSQKLTSGFFLLSICSASSAMELVTHGILTQHAYEKSVLKDEVVLKSLGLDVLNKKPDPFGETYYDISGNTILARKRDKFEGRLITRYVSTSSTDLASWLLRGAIREDDFPGGPQPSDDTIPGDLFRIANHFFDPYNNSPLSGPSIIQREKAPNWAIGTANAFESPVQPNPARKNHYSIFDARESMYRALTGKKSDRSDAGLSGEHVTEKERLAYWATVFRSLGDVVHLVEDMAQPQHTRDELHAGIPLLGHKSYFESYLEGRAKNITEQPIFGSTPRPAVPLTSLTLNSNPVSLKDYDIPRFTKYSDYWSTKPGNESHTGSGLADYSNRGFFTPGKNFDDISYPYPRGETLAPLKVPFPTPWYSWTKTVFLEGPVRDNRISTPVNIKLTTKSAWQIFGIPITATYALNRANYDDYAALLLPRAVGYSAGLINYFFRGRMQLGLPDDGMYAVLDHSVDKTIGQGFKKLKVKVRNSTYNETMGTGTLVAVVKFHRDNCYGEKLEDPLLLNSDAGCRDTVEDIVTSKVIDVTGVDLVLQEYTFDFEDNVIPLNAVDLTLQVVFRGKLGEEENAVVVETREISEPHYISAFNFTDKYCVAGTWWEPAAIKADVQANPTRYPGWSDAMYLQTPFDVYLSLRPGVPNQIHVAQVQPAGFTRIAVLVDSTPRLPRLAVTATTTAANPYAFFSSGSYDNSFITTLFKFDELTNGWRSANNLVKVRGVSSASNLIFYRSYPTPTTKCDHNQLPEIGGAVPKKAATLPF